MAPPSLTTNGVPANNQLNGDVLGRALTQAGLLTTGTKAPVTPTTTKANEPSLKDAFPNHPHGGPPGLMKKMDKAGGKAGKAGKGGKDDDDSFAGALQRAGGVTGGAAMAPTQGLSNTANAQLNAGIAKNLKVLSQGTAGVFA